jgi:hypothetical protein
MEPCGLNTGEAVDSDSTNSSGRIFAFFGRDLQVRGMGTLHRAVAAGYTPLPLDADGLGLTRQAGASFTLIDDWLDFASMIKAQTDADYSAKYWYETARTKFTNDGVCWPEADREAWKHFWRDAFVACAFAKAFHERGGIALRFLQAAPPSPKVWHTPSTLFMVLWQNLLPGIAGPWESLGPEGSTFSRLRKLLRDKYLQARGLAGLARRTIKRWPAQTQNALGAWSLKVRGRRPPALANLSGRVLLVINPGEAFRFTPVVQDLCTVLPEQVGAVLIGKNQGQERRYSQVWQCPVQSAPTVLESGPSPTVDFASAFQKVVEESTDHPWSLAVTHLQEQFLYYCTYRWPLLVSTLRTWTDLWMDVRPRAVIVSGLQDLESQLPALAAKRMGIPTFAVPHGGVFPTPSICDAVGNFLYSFKPQKTFWESAGFNNVRLIPSRDLLPINEYKMERRASFDPRARCRILVLTSLTTFPGCIAPSIAPRAQIEALRVLSNPPQDLRADIQIKFKTHPRYTEWGLFEAAGIDTDKFVVPADSSLAALLPSVDLVVSLNNIGSAAVHSLGVGKPVIYFFTDPRRLIPEISLLPQVFAFSGQFAHGCAEFWPLVTKFLTDEAFGQEMRLQAWTYFKENLDDSLYPTIGEVISSTMTGSSVQ